MRKHLFSSLWARKRRLLGGAIAVVIGVAFLAATLVLGDAMKIGIHSLLAESNSGTDALVRSELEIGTADMSTRSTVDERLVSELAGNPDVASALPVVEGVAQLSGADGELIGGDGPPTFGGNWLDFERNPYELVDGRAPQRAGEIVIDSDSADGGDLHVGDTTTVRVPDPIEVTVVGIAELRSGESLGGVTYTWFDTDTAQRLLLHSDDLVSAVNLTAAPGVSPEQLVAVVQPALPSGIEAVTGTTLTAEDDADIAADFLDFFETFLLMFAGVALLVSTFTIHNTFSIVVAQRTRESALLRALGASRRQVLTAVVIESLVVGIVASAIGLFSGLLLANGLHALLEAIGLGIPTAALALDSTTVIVSMVVGVVVTLIAGLTPAIKASRVAPLAALRDVEVDRSGASIVRAVLGTLVTGGGVALVVTASQDPDSAMQLAGLGSLLTVIGAVLIGPVVARLATALIGIPVRMFGGQSGKLARRNSMRNPRRTAGTASALMLGTAVVALFATFAASIKQSLDDLIANAYEGDLVVVQEGWGGVGLSRDLAPAIDALPEVETATGLTFANFTVDGETADEPFAIDPAAVDAVVDLDVVAGSLQTMDATGIAVSEAYANDKGWTLGSPVSVGFADGAVDELHVAVVYKDANILGDLMIDEDAWLLHTPRSDDFIVLISLADGVSVAQGRAAIDPLTEQFGAPASMDRGEYLESATEDIDQMLGLVYGLLGLAILIALLGIANTLSLSLYERTRELGLLRAVGQTRRQLRRTVRWESVIIAVFGTIGGVAVGTFLAWGLMRAIEASEVIGSFVVPVTTLVVVVGAAIVAGVVAAIRPARRAAKLDVLEAIATS
jgi:putative ABC transport system permease protein